MNYLIAKERRAIKFIKKAYPLACDMSSEGFHVAFSGGKDSQVLLALMEESGCKYKAHMQVTSVDPPQLMRFVRSNYPDVRLHLPEVNMYNLIIQKGILPMRQCRYCCEKLKEHAGSGTCTCVGVRAAESSRRAKRNDIEINGFKGAGFEIDSNNTLSSHKQFDLFEVENETVVSCVGGSDKIILSPIFRWSDSDVWRYIKANRIEYCELYNMGFHRIGCMFCPMASAKEKALSLSLFKTQAERIYIKAIRELINIGKYPEFETPEEVFFWWISNQNRDKFLSKKKMYRLLF